jgi:chaperonin cofactor prefoldin
MINKLHEKEKNIRINMLFIIMMQRRLVIKIKKNYSKKLNEYRKILKEEKIEENKNVLKSVGVEFNEHGFDKDEECSELAKKWRVNNE